MEKHLKNDIKKLNQVKHTKKAVKNCIQIVKNIDDPRTRHCHDPLHAPLNEIRPVHRHRHRALRRKFLP